MKFHPLTGEFARTADETEFLNSQLSRTRSLLGFTLLFCVIFFQLFFLTDIAALGLDAALRETLPARLGVALIGGTGAWLAYRRPLSVAGTRLAASSAEILSLGCFMVVALARPNEVHWHALSMVVIQVVIYLYIPNRLAYATAIVSGGVIVFLALVHYLLPPRPVADLLTMGMLLAMINTFGILAARRFNRVAREEFRLQTQLKRLAERDQLTGCYNRHYLNDHLLGAELARARRFGHAVSVVLCDIDHFKHINDTFGHHQGDHVIQNFATLLQGMTRQGVDAVVRYGGEEFLLILPVTGLAGAAVLADRLRDAFAASTFTVDGEPVPTSASFGVATFDFSSKDLRVTLPDLIVAADKQLYAAKRNGRNRVESVELAV
ncbi:MULTISPECIES: GGDEF domain-containing protein [Massilia]|uniref:diguanylate cyclase n=1 Tax=Massilia aurea TaxID=373040 RepID=A0A422QLZ4_9BURK|nr:MULTISPECIES: GGDEF domain-containing protein [Massilia]MDY0963190.1 GGDEF domain-containing protein [Massilia sp. CFBP9026]RNF31007.1 diguanylate cyclase [Massilia aurea]